MPDTVQIELAEGAAEIGLAVMLRDLLTQNLEQNPPKFLDFNKLNIPIGLNVSDAEIKLTLEFSKGSLTIYNGIKDNAGLNITAENIGGYEKRQTKS
jgi:hypothetical protein